MKITNGIVYCNHGKESGPWGSKIKQIALVAQAKDWAVESIDYTDLADPDERVQRLLDACAAEARRLILVGSSMGGYVATVAAETCKPAGLFLMAPALYMPGYAHQDPAPATKSITVVHGWNDDVIPVEHSIRFAQKFKTQLHLVDGDHRLTSRIPFIATQFGLFLDQIVHGEEVWTGANDG